VLFLVLSALFATDLFSPLGENVMTLLTGAALPRLNAHPDQVQFPTGSLR